MTKELTPCPGCGNTKITVQVGSINSVFDRTAYAICKCGRCATGITIDDVINKWNSQKRGKMGSETDQGRI